MCVKHVGESKQVSACLSFRNRHQQKMDKKANQDPACIAHFLTLETKLIQ